MQEMQVGKGVRLHDGDDVALLTIGPLGNRAAKAAERAREKGISVAHYNMIFLKPLDEEMLHEVGKKFKKVITVEDGAIKGGFGSAVLEFFADHDYEVHVKRIGLPDKFVEHGSQDELYAMLGMNEEGIYNVLLETKDF